MVLAATPLAYKEVVLQEKTGQSQKGFMLLACFKKKKKVSSEITVNSMGKKTAQLTGCGQ